MEMAVCLQVGMSVCRLLPGCQRQQKRSIHSYLYIYEPQTGIQQDNVTQKVNFIWSKNRQVKGNTERERKKKKGMGDFRFRQHGRRIRFPGSETVRATVSQPVSLLSG